MLSNCYVVNFLCSGLTEANYKELNVLYEKYKDQGLEILAFPCNQFAWQEPGTNEEIQETVCTRFKAEFPVFDKVEVNGKNTAPLFKFLKSEKGGLLLDAIKWNFTKFLVNKEGKVVERYGPRTSPLQFEEDIKKLLALDTPQLVSYYVLFLRLYMLKFNLGYYCGSYIYTCVVLQGFLRQNPFQSTKSCHNFNFSISYVALEL
ncbi:hypothetical protein Leryth_001807 [Lithospermum erythrorhizon]|nr:hypothetical protein Leryth_001807 [Lithospermum erythrorhizon]